MLVSQFGYNLVPMGRVSQHRRGDSPATRSGEQAGIIVGCFVEPCGEYRPDFLDQRHRAGTLSFRTLVDEATRPWCGLASYGPQPTVSVNVFLPDTGDFADACGRACSGFHYVAPSLIPAMRPGHERGGELRPAPARPQRDDPCLGPPGHQRGLALPGGPRLLLGLAYQLPVVGELAASLLPVHGVGVYRGARARKRPRNCGRWRVPEPRARRHCPTLRLCRRSMIRFTLRRSILSSCAMER